jgi:hypothetical protein
MVSWSCITRPFARKRYPRASSRFLLRNSYRRECDQPLRPASRTTVQYRLPDPSVSPQDSTLQAALMERPRQRFPGSVVGGCVSPSDPIVPRRRGRAINRRAPLAPAEEPHGVGRGDESGRGELGPEPSRRQRGTGEAVDPGSFKGSATERTERLLVSRRSGVRLRFRHRGDPQGGQSSG